MTRFTTFPDKRIRPVGLAIALMLFLTAFLLAAGCESQNPAPATPADTTVTTQNTLPPRTISTTNPPVVTTSREPEPSPEVTTEVQVLTPDATIVVSGNYHQEYIRMDATTYSVGEGVQFFLVNKGPEISGCDYARPIPCITSPQPAPASRSPHLTRPARI